MQRIHAAARAALSQIASTTNRHNLVELEMRLGHLKDQQFVAGISQESFQELQRGFLQATDFRTYTSQHVEDFYYKDKQDVSTRLSRWTKPDSKLMVQRLVKKNVFQETIKICNCDFADAVRVSVSVETPAVDSDQPEYVIPTLVRHKFRHVYGLDHCQYELTEIFAGKSKSQVDSMVLEKRGATYECEIEIKQSAYNAGTTAEGLADLMCKRILAFVRS